MSATINKLMTTMVGKSAEFQYSDKSVIMIQLLMLNNVFVINSSPIDNRDLFAVK